MRTIPLVASWVTTVTRPPPLAKSSASSSSTGRSCSENRARVTSERRVGGDRAPAECGRATTPVGEHAAGFGDDRLQRRGVPRPDDPVDHHLGATGGDEKVAVAVPPRTGDCALRGERAPAIDVLRGVAEAF